jgi:heme-degrading monooxygenase HmoA
MNKSLPYYAVIFTSLLSEKTDGYAEMSNKMEKLAKLQDGFLGMNSARNDIGITISYWDSLEAIKNWKQQSDHLIAQEKGKSDWYSWYNIKICKVEREYEFEIN